MSLPCSLVQFVSFAKDIVQILALGVGVPFAWWQLRIHSQNRRLQSLLAIMRYVESSEISSVRWFAYKHHQDIEKVLDQPFATEFERLDSLDALIRRKTNNALTLQKVEYAVNAINIVAYLILKKYAEYKIVPNMLDSTFLRTSTYFEKYIDYRRGKGRIRLPKDGKLPKRSKYAHYLQTIAHRINRPNLFEKLKQYFKALNKLSELQDGRDVLEHIKRLEADVLQLKGMRHQHSASTSAQANTAPLDAALL